MKKKIVYITSSRADFGIVSSLLLKLEKSSKIDFYLIVTGTHFLKKFGHLEASVILGGATTRTLLKI